MIAIVDYGVGNLFSLKSSLAAIGAEAVVTGDADALRAADRIILPGVGAFGDAADKLAASGLRETVLAESQAGKPLLGICLGMQLLFDKSMEYGEHAGLGLIPGTVVDLTPVLPEGLKVPHIGWNALKLSAPDHPLLKYTRAGDCVYFVHSFYAVNCAEYTLATAEYGVDVTAVVARGNVMGCQFHPEKSGSVGLNILRAFCEMETPV
ncbi:MAG: imidazole glycerol phosphate synthase subunit HisH [Oscillospiraceae bacterium]|nr:imidazole glycerol phosphate synthase subunit HisH [Oscillospiraceae bacterium]MBQ9046228.1 imidazole glycerol phosphate synthase subunit HisH [Oscillospiraceae bacterium]